MPDISMCGGKNCPLRSTCFRYLAKPDKLQSYSPFEYKQGSCDHEWDIRERGITAYHSRIDVELLAKELAEKHRNAKKEVIFEDLKGILQWR